jgi:hypothetical protein
MRPNNIGELAAKMNQLKDVEMSDRSTGFAPMAAGPYIVSVEKAMWDAAKNGTPGIAWHLRVVDGPHIGRILFKHHYLKEGSEANLKHLAQDLKLVLGEVPDINNDEFLTRLLDKVLFVRKQNKDDDRYEIWINGVDNRVEGDSPVSAVPDPTVFADDDIPF